MSPITYETLKQDHPIILAILVAFAFFTTLMVFHNLTTGRINTNKCLFIQFFHFINFLLLSGTGKPSQQAASSPNTASSPEKKGDANAPSSPKPFGSVGKFKVFLGFLQGK